MTPCRIEDVLASEGVYAATTWGTSMYPMLRSGRDTVILRPPQGRLRCIMHYRLVYLRSAASFWLESWQNGGCGS